MQSKNSRHPVVNRVNHNHTKNKKSRKKKFSPIKFLLFVLFLIIFIIGGGAFGFIIATVKNAPKIDPEMAGVFLNENSFIVDKNGNMIEKILTQEIRTVLPLSEISPHLQHAIIAIEDERFKDHFGIDLKRIVGALIADIKAGKVVQGASTITQQLVKQLYLSEHVDRNNLMNDLQRKIMEAHLAMQLEKKLSKDQILEAYLNLSPFGQGAYGVQAAAQTYFSKDAKDITIPEAAMIAGITKSPLSRAIYKRIEPSDFNPAVHEKLGEIEILGKKYIAVYNPVAENRQKIILKKMYELGYINQKEYEAAKNFDIKADVKIKPIVTEEISTNYFNDYVKKSVIEDLMKKYGYSKRRAQDVLFKGGLKIYATVDLTMQSHLEETYTAFNDLLDGMVKSSDRKRTIFVSKRTDKQGNIINPKLGNQVVFYASENLLTPDGDLFLLSGEYRFEGNGDLTLKTPKINHRNLDITDYYTIDDNSLVSHAIWSLDIKKEIEENGRQKIYYTTNLEDKSVTIKKAFLEAHTDFFVRDGDTLIIKANYFYNDKLGTVQPQSASVIYDYKTGHILAMVGGRSLKGKEPTGQMLLNRATDSPRQPGSSIKPLSVYTAALEQGYTAATAIDDIPHYDKSRKIWPENWYGKNNGNLGDDYYGYVTVREAIRMSMNVPAVKVLENIGIGAAVDALTRYHIINPDFPSQDTFVSRSESVNSDEDIAPLALGGMNYGITPLKMAAAFGSIANQGIYTEPVSYTKVLNNKGEVILENSPARSTVTSPQIAYIMTDMLVNVVSRGTATQAQLFKGNKKIPVAGKTGTTQDSADSWFIGYTPYYVTATWVGNDNPALKISATSTLAKNLWKKIMFPIHENLEPKNFDKPEGIVSASVCRVSGKRPSELCSMDPRGNTIITEMFVEGTVPTESCEVHVIADVCKLDGLLASPNTPPELIEKKVFITRPDGYIPEENGGFIPMDYAYMLPAKFTQLFDAVQYDEFGNPIIQYDEFGNPITPPTDSKMPDWLKIPPEDTEMPPDSGTPDDGNSTQNP